MTWQIGFIGLGFMKDARIVLDAAREAGSPLPSFEVVAAQLERLVETGGGELDSSALYTLLSDE